MWVRLAKIGLVALAASYATAVAFNNITDYGFNYEFVRHVLSMDTTFPGNRGMWRAIDAPLLHHAAYVTIIGTELATAVLGWLGVAALWRSRSNPAQFSKSKRLAGYALLLGVVLWFGGFIVVGGEWFLMWQSDVWNGIESAFRIAVFFTIVLIFLAADD